MAKFTAALLGLHDMYATCFLDVWAGSCGKSLLTEDRKANLTDPDIVEGIVLDGYVQTNSPADSINCQHARSGDALLSGQKRI